MAATQTYHRRTTEEMRNSITPEQFENADELYNDVALVADGKKIYTNSSLLAYNSPVFAELLRGRYSNDGDDVMDTDRRNGTLRPIQFRSGSSQFGPVGHTAMSWPPLEVVVPKQNYKVVKSLVAFLPTKEGTSGQLTSDVAFKIFPLVAEYRMSKLKKKCANVLKTSFESLYNKMDIGKIPMTVVFKYLAAAEKYGLEKLKTLCIQECGAKVKGSSRQEIVDDEHISDKVKIKILDAMCDSMSQHYEENLKELREEIDDEFKESDRKRKEFNNITDKWKKLMNENVDNALQDVKAAHEKLADQLEKKKIIDCLDKALNATTEDLVSEQNMLREQVDFVVQHVEANLHQLPGNTDQFQVNVDTHDADSTTKDAEEEIALWMELRDNLQKSFETNIYNIEIIRDTLSYSMGHRIKTCTMGNLDAMVNRNLEVHDSLDKAYAQLKLNDKCMTEASVKEKQREMELERTKVQLRKHMSKTHQMNTWLKWAKPADNNEEKCSCFRHCQSRKTAS